MVLSKVFNWFLKLDLTFKIAIYFILFTLIAVIGINIFANLEANSIEVKINDYSKNTNFNIYNENNQMVKSANTGEKIKLATGKYYAKANLSNASKDYKDNFEITKFTKEIHLNGLYNKEFRISSLNNELNNINKAIREKYPEVDKYYEIKDGRLLMLNDWYATYLVAKDTVDEKNRDNLKIVLQKKDNKWVVHNEAMPIISNDNIIPTYVLSYVQSIGNTIASYEESAYPTRQPIE